ncbi:alpha/beta hydrolase [Blautia obeum]|nr:alpha/beta hydrolase [Blautia obeum]
MHYNYNGFKIHYEMIGCGKPIIILHGLGCNLELMKGCMEPILSEVENYKRIYVDLPGMGESDAMIDFATSDEILEILISFILNITEQNFLLIGESYGGYLARGILSRLYNRIEGMFLLCPVVTPNHENRTIPNVTVKFNDSIYLDTLPEAVKQGFCEYSVLANEQTYHRYQAEILPGLKQANSEFIAKLESNYSFEFDVDQIIKKIHFSKPTLFICGRQDVCVGYQDLWNILEDYSRATFSVLDVAGHNLQIEQPDLFNALVYNWLERVEKY